MPRGGLPLPMDEQSSGENSPETAKGICIGTAHFFPFGPLGWEDEPFPRALPLHASTPPRESAGRQKRNARTGLGAAVRGGEPASLRAGERVRDVGRNRFERGSIESPHMTISFYYVFRAYFCATLTTNKTLCYHKVVQINQPKFLL